MKTEGPQEELIARVEGEIRAALSLILGPAQRLGASRGLTADQRHDVELIHRAASSLSSQIDTLMGNTGAAISLATMVDDQVELVAPSGAAALRSGGSVEHEGVAALAVLEALVAGAPLGFAFFDRDLRYVRVNDYLAAIHGVTPEAHVGLGILEVFPALSAAIAPIARRVLESGEPALRFDVDWKDPAGTGNHRHWSASLYPVRSKDGHLLGVGQVLADVTERKQIDEALRASNETLQSVIQATPLPIFAVDRHLRVRIWNPAAERALGWSEAELIGRRFPSVPQGRKEELAAAIARVLRGDPAVRLVTRRKRRDGTELDVCVNIAPLHEADGQVSGVIAVYQDISDRIRFLQVAAHELRNPMAAIKGILGLQRRRTAAGLPVGDIASVMNVMEKEVDRLSALFNQIMEAFRLLEGHWIFKEETVDLNQVVSGALNAYGVAEGKHQFVVPGMDQAPVWVWGDAGHLLKVFSNLVDNAVKYSPDGGTVGVRISQSESEATVSVSDEGQGIPKHQLPQVFQPFFRADSRKGRDPGGMGLGLYVCRDIVVHHRGHIWVESEEGAGTTFHVTLPLCTKDPPHHTIRSS